MTKIYHNPRCSKSRQTLALLEEHVKNPEIIEYLKTPPTHEELNTILSQLKITARDLLRTKEPEYKALGLDDKSMSDEAIIDAMINAPKLIERPIVVHNKKAALGRPPENILTLF